MVPPKVFISYSWKPIHNKQKVLQLAERLSIDFVHVILDDWDLKEGQDKYQFMEQMVNNPEVIRVLIVCNKEYSDKANFKKGGVGIESLIVSDEIYNNADQTKFIPIIFEYSDDGKPCVPTFIHSRIFVDLSSDEIYEENYEKLLRNIFDKPTSKRPPIGTMPAFLQSDDPIFLPTAHKVTTIKNALINEKKNTPLYIQDYLDTFVSSLNSFAIDEKDLNENNYDEVILKKIEDLKVLRDDFIDFTEMYLSYSVIIDSDKLHNFFEKLLNFLANINDLNYSSNTLAYLKSDYFRFFYYELFLTFAAILIAKERFDELAYILQTPFIIEKKNSGEILQQSFSEFRQYVATLNEHRNKKYKLNKISVTADTLKQRASEKYGFEKLRETDLLLFYISLLFPSPKKNYFSYSYWFPETTCSRFWYTKLLAKTVSERYFNKVKILFGVKDKNELIAKVEEITNAGLDKNNDHNFSVPEMKSGLALTEMCTIK
jgi:hypothetical protein